MLTEIWNERAVDVAAGAEHTVLLTTSGSATHVWTCGYGEQGRLGHGNWTRQEQPTRFMSKWVLFNSLSLFVESVPPLRYVYGAGTIP